MILLMRYPPGEEVYVPTAEDARFIAWITTDEARRFVGAFSAVAADASDDPAGEHQCDFVKFLERPLPACVKFLLDEQLIIPSRAPGGVA